MEAPKHLSPEATDLWRSIVEDYGIDDDAGQLILTSALEAFDRMREAQATLAKDGATVMDRFDQVKAHPAVNTERDSRIALMACLKQLNLDLEPLRDTVGRPPQK